MLNHSYVHAVTEAGGIPLLLAIGVQEDVKQLTEQLDGLLLSGGFDIDPWKYKEEPHKELGEISPGRDTYELKLAEAFLQANKPVLGICRGHQVLNVVQGGTMYQDIHAQHDRPIQQHVQQSRRDHVSHTVHLTQGSRLAEIMGSPSIRVNSFHHQAVKELGDSLVVSGTANDGIIEAVESEKHPFVIGVQWHPENCVSTGDVYSRKLFKAFVHACR